MTVALPGQTPAILGFAFPAGLALALSAVLLVAYPPRVEVPTDEAEVERASGLTHLYLTLDAPIFIGLGTGPMLRMDLAVSIAGTRDQLMQLNVAVDGAQPRLRAAVVEVAQAMVLEGADSRAMHEALPERARAAVNQMIGTEEFPEPVTEILIIGLAIKD